MRGMTVPVPARVARCMAMMLMCGLCGCAGLQVKLGWKVSLEKTQVVSMAPELVNGPAEVPGAKQKMIVSFKGADGKEYVTEGAGHGKVMWRDLALSSTVVQVSKKGTVSLSADPRVSDKQTGKVELSVKAQPAIRAELAVPVRYDAAFSAIYAGPSGSSGMNGSDGTAGSSGSPGSTDPDHPSAGGDGGNGTNGSDGTDGGNGGDGPDVTVQVRYRTKSKLLQVSVSADRGTPRYFLVDPNGGSLTVRSDGGAGGSGGRGGRGGAGGSGGSGSPPGSSGSSGSDGRNGNDGSSGSPGRVSVMYDPGAASYLATLNVPPGSTMTATPVGKMW